MDRIREVLQALGYHLHTDDNGNYWDLSGERWMLESQWREYRHVIAHDMYVVAMVAHILGARL